MAGLAAFGLLTSGCTAAGTGTRDEGAAVPAPVQQGIRSTAPTRAPGMGNVNVVKLLREDPEVSRRIKDDIKPCAPGAYPIDTSYGDLTGNTTPDVVVNVMACGDGVGRGTYVYREENKKYENVFKVEATAVYGTIDRGDLVVTQQDYMKDDPTMSYPSGEDEETYVWSGTKFVGRYQVHNDYSRAVGNDSFITGTRTGPETTTTT